MTMATDKQDKVLNFSSEQEQSGACSSSAEREKNQGKNFPNVPNLRFPEFSGDWKESTIGKEFELYSGNTPSRLDKENFVGDVNWITSGELKDHYIGDTKEKISEKSAKENNLRLMPEGTFVIAIYGLEAEGVRSTGSIITKRSTISQACMAFTPKGDISNEFLYSWYKKHGNVIGIRYAQGTKQQNLSYDIIEKFKIHYPSLKEQDKLNSFISLLDTRIATQIRIIEDLKLYRDTLMFKLLSPRKNWEHVCIHDVAMVVGGGTPDTNIKEYWDGNIQWFTPSEIGKEKYVIASERTISQAGLDNSSAKLLPANTILLSTRATIGECSIAKQECCTNQGFQSLIATTVTPEFLYYLIQTKKRDLLSKASGSTFSEISANEVRKIRICIPTTAKEQKAIVQPLSAYDEKIETECKMLQLYKRQKQFLLSQMFI